MCFPIRSYILNTFKIPMRQGLSYTEGIQIQDESGINTVKSYLDAKKSGIQIVENKMAALCNPVFHMLRTISVSIF